jgi:hypothetical protein
VLTGQLLEAGLTLVTEAQGFAKSDLARARGVRNGLMVALLALCPIRLKNFATLEIGKTFREVKLADVHASRAAYDRADRLKAGITADQQAINALPMVTNADPQAASMAAFLQWASFGRLGPSTNAVAVSRIGVVVIFLALPGFLLMLCGLRRAA